MKPVWHRYRSLSTATWNQKNLDYEIETLVGRKRYLVHGYLKSKEPRLRDWNYRSVTVPGATSPPWNQKNLDYEIETGPCPDSDRRRISGLKSKEPRLRDWNKKNLLFLKKRFQFLKSKEPRLRDWNIDNDRGRCSRNTPNLKSKEPRLRDWNIEYDTWYYHKKATWNQKNLDYEIETGFIFPASTIEKYDLKSKEPRLRDWNDTSTHRKPSNQETWNQKNLDYEIETLCKARWLCLLR